MIHDHNHQIAVRSLAWDMPNDEKNAMRRRMDSGQKRRRNVRPQKPSDWALARTFIFGCGASLDAHSCAVHWHLFSRLITLFLLFATVFDAWMRLSEIERIMVLKGKWTSEKSECLLQWTWKKWLMNRGRSHSWGQRALGNRMGKLAQKMIEIENLCHNVTEVVDPMPIQWNFNQMNL